MKRLGITAAVVGAIACAPAPAPVLAPRSAPRLAAGALPSLERWRQHVTDELMPFWITPDALGNPIGNFPTFRCNDGTAYHPEAPCPELAHPPDWIFHWKNGYHEMEHALVALITTAGLTGQSLALYYAFVKTPPRPRIQPYYFSGVIADERDHPLPLHPGLHGRRVEFRELR